RLHETAPSLFLFGDVIDRAGHATNSGADQRTLARAVTRAGADRGARTRADRGTGRGTATGESQTEHRHRKYGCEQFLHGSLLPHAPTVQSTDQRSARIPRLVPLGASGSGEAQV